MTAGLPCPCCSRSMRYLDTRQEILPGRTQEEHVVYEVCPDCGVIGKNPMPTAAELWKYYAQGWQAESPRPPECYSSAARWIEKSYPPVVWRRHFGAVLDVGSKNRALLDALSGIVGIGKGKCVDPSLKDSGYAWSEEGALRREPGDEQVYGLVCSTHVLEHVFDPVSYISSLIEPLGGGRGHVYIEVPAPERGGEFCSDNIHTAHLWHFSLNSLALLAKKAALRVRSYAHVALAALETDSSVPGWPVNRMLLRKEQVPDTQHLTDIERAWGGMVNAEIDAYVDAAKRLQALNPKDTVLYGVSQSLSKLLRTAAGLGMKLTDFETADLYKTGVFEGREILSPQQAFARFKRAAVCTRFPNSQQDIEKYLHETFPAVEIVQVFS